MRISAILCVLALIALLAACQTNATKPSVTLNTAEVEHLFVGNTVESFNLNTGFTSFTYYHPNGQAMQERLWAKRLGAWSLTEDGKICLQFGKAALKCRHIVLQDGRYFKIRPDDQGVSKRIVRYRYFASGNALMPE